MEKVRSFFCIGNFMINTYIACKYNVEHNTNFMNIYTCVKGSDVGLAYMYHLLGRYYNGQVNV